MYPSGPRSTIGILHHTCPSCIHLHPAHKGLSDRVNRRYVNLL